MGRLRTRCRWGPVDGVGKGCGLCARTKQALYPSPHKPGREPILGPRPGVSTRGRFNSTSATSKYTLRHHVGWSIRYCMCRGPYRAVAHDPTGGDAARRRTTRRFGPIQRGGASIRHGASYQSTIRRCHKTLSSMSHPPPKKKRAQTVQYDRGRPPRRDAREDARLAPRQGWYSPKLRY